jgi:hypothetical protein
LSNLSKEKLIQTLNEKPVAIDEAGLEFKKAGIRVWFENMGNGPVTQIFTERKDLNFNGAKIGDQIDDFQKALGNPVSDKNGDVHFRYQGIFLSLPYNTETGATSCVYFLKADF